MRRDLVWSGRLHELVKMNNALDTCMYMYNFIHIYLCCIMVNYYRMIL